MIIYITFWISYIVLNINYPGLNPAIKKTLKATSILFFIVLLGGRENVGKDYSNYVDYFKGIQSAAFLEPGYDLLNLSISNLGLDVSFVFLIMAILSSIFIFKSFDNNNDIKTLPTSLLIVVFGFLFLSNGVRQGLAVSIFFFAYRFIKNRQFLYYICCIAFACLFHYSAILLIPIYFFTTKSYPIWLYLSVFTVSLLSIFLFNSSFLMKLNFISYINRYENNSLLTETTLSAGNILILLFNLFAFIFSLYKRTYKANPIIFNLFFIYIILTNTQMAVALLTRLSIYFLWFSYAWLPIMYYQYKNFMPRISSIFVRNLIILYYLIIALNSYLYFDTYHSVWF